MYSLLVRIGSNPPAKPDVLERASRITRKLMPRLGSDLTECVASFDAIGAGWFYFLPEPTRERPLITEATDGATKVLVFGEVDSDQGESPAALVHQAWHQSGADAVRLLAGSFSAVILECEPAAAYVISDVVGRRPLRYLAHDRELWISTHDVPIVATGLCPLEFDLVSAAAVLAWEWSLEGKSLLKSIRCCNATGYLQWQGGSVREVADDIYFREGRIDPGDRASLKQLHARMIASLRRGVSQRCANANLVRADLTAGLDSRAVLAALLACLPRKRILTATAGDAGHLDVKVAARIARMYGVRHRQSVPSPPAVDGFLDNCDVFAFFMNGATNSKRALGSPLRYDPQAPRVVGGNGGEIFRGWYYPDRQSGRLPPLSVTQAHSLLRRERATDRFPWGDPAMALALNERLDRIVNRYSSWTQNGYDILDLFYLQERFARWALGARMPQEENVFFPFENSAVIRDAFRLPPPIALHCTLHRSLIRRGLPRGYWVPVNGKSWLPLAESSSSLVRKVREWVLRPAARAPPASAPVRGIETVQAELLRGKLGDCVRDLLLTERTLATELFDRSRLQNMVDTHLEGRENHMQTLGFLITFARYRSQVERARELSLMD